MPAESAVALKSTSKTWGAALLTVPLVDPTSWSPRLEEAEAEKLRPAADAVLSVTGIGVPIEDRPAVVAAVIETGLTVIVGAAVRLRLTLMTWAPSGPVTVTEPFCVPAAMVAIFGTEIRREPGVVPEAGETDNQAELELVVNATPFAAAPPCVAVTPTEDVGTTVVPTVPPKLKFACETETTGMGGAVMVS
jgi:hypothetical protein